METFSLIFAGCYLAVISLKTGNAYLNARKQFNQLVQSLTLLLFTFTSCVLKYVSLEFQHIYF